MTKVLIADKNYLSRIGLEMLIESAHSFQLIPSVDDNLKGLSKKINLFSPDLLIIDFYSLSITTGEIKLMTRKYPNIKILAVTDLLSKNEMSSALNNGVTSYLLKECDKEEILEAIESTLLGKQFLCGKIASVLTSEPEINLSRNLIKTFSCEGFTVTERELEIVKFIAEGLSNKLIADKLNLSTHTINTHRKNIMAKLQVNNTAGIVMFAVKNNLLETNHFLFSN